MKIQKSLLWALISSIILSGCVSPELKDEIVKNVDEANAKVANGKLQYESQVSDVATGMNLVRESEQIWLGDRRKIRKGKSLPSAFSNTFEIHQLYKDVADVAESITAMTGFKVTVSEYDRLQKSDSNKQVSFSGTLEGFLDLLTTQERLNWRYDDSGINIFKTESRVFDIYALPGSQKVSSSSKTTDKTESLSGGIDNNVDLNQWKSLENQLLTMLSSVGKLAFSPEIGSVVITDEPKVLDKVEEFLNKNNSKMVLQTAINVQVYSVSRGKNDNQALNISALLKGNGINFRAFNPTSITTTPEGMPSVGVFNSTDLSDKDLSGALFTALNKRKDVSLMTSASVTTLNNKMAPIFVGNKRKYIKELTSTVTPSVTTPTTSTTVTTDELETGFMINLLPSIIEKHRLLLRVDINLLNLIAMEKFVLKSGDSLQLPTVDNRSFQQEVLLRSGETLVMAGFEKVGGELEEAGMFDPSIRFPYGAAQGAGNREQLLIFITPVLL